MLYAPTADATPPVTCAMVRGWFTYTHTMNAAYSDVQAAPASRVIRAFIPVIVSYSDADRKPAMNLVVIRDGIL